MGVEMEHYVVLGINTMFNELEKVLNIPEGDNIEDHLEGVLSSYDAEAGDYVYISDGMNGEYAILGMIISKGKEYEGLEMTDCMGVYEEYSSVVQNKLESLGIKGYKISVYAFTHFH